MQAIEAWRGLRLEYQLGQGNRNEVWAATFRGRRVAVRRSRRSGKSLSWELRLLRTLADRGFVVPQIIKTDEGADSFDGVVVQEWLHGKPPVSEREWRLVAAELQRLHTTCGDLPQRPGCMVVTELDRNSRSVDADMSALPADVLALVLGTFDSLPDIPVSLVHGDPGASNIRITDDDLVGLLDWDESRLDLTWHDLSNLGVVVLDATSHRRATQLSDAWEAINGWTTEPAYARSRLANLRRS